MKTNVKEIFQYALAALIVIGFFTTIAMLILVTVPESNKDSLSIITGALITAFAAVVGYFFGSSISSAKKDETIAQQNTDLLQKKNETINNIQNGKDSN